MTESEAIKELKIHIEYLKYNWKPHPDYRVLEALNIGIESLEKQMPKKPNKYIGFDTSLFICPNCGRKQPIMYGQYYCKECGQKLDWSDTD